jgi:hypothetical protein
MSLFVWPDAPTFSRPRRRSARSVLTADGPAGDDRQLGAWQGENLAPPELPGVGRGKQPAGLGAAPPAFARELELVQQQRDRLQQRADAAESRVKELEARLGDREVALAAALRRCEELLGAVQDRDRALDDARRLLERRSAMARNSELVPAWVAPPSFFKNSRFF